MGAALRVTLVIPTPALPCGVFEYTATLAEHLSRCPAPTQVQAILQATVLSGSHAHILDRLRSDPTTDLLHLQFGYYLYPPDYLTQILELARRQGWPSLITMHGFRPDMTAHHEIIRRYRTPFIVHSNSMKQGLMACGIAEERIDVLAMPCPDPLPPRQLHQHPQQPPPSPPRLPHQPHQPHQQRRIGYFGFLLPHKGLRELCCALGLLVPTYPDLTATILSARAPFGVSGEYATVIEHTLAEERLRERISWHTGFLSEQQILTELARCAVIVLPYQEHTEIGVSYAASVALASGRPLITTRVSFFENLNGVASQTTSNQPDELARAIRAMLDDPARQATFAAQARSYASHNTWANAAAAHKASYGHLLTHLS